MTDSQQPPQPPWYVSAFDRSYLERYRHRDDAEAERQIEFLFSACGLTGRAEASRRERVLDLCCGAGRHAIQLARRGATPIGVDLSHELLLEARSAGERANLSIEVARSDMRRLPFSAGSFALVIQMFTAFGYFEEDAENRQVLAEVARVLAPGGRYLLDLLNRNFVVRHLVPESTETRADGTLVRQLRRFDQERGRIEKRIFESSARGHITQRFESVRIFDREEITDWLHAAGLEVVSLHGRFDDGGFDPDGSERMIVLARRPR